MREQGCLYIRRLSIQPNWFLTLDRAPRWLHFDRSLALPVVRNSVQLFKHSVDNGLLLDVLWCIWVWVDQFIIQGRSSTRQECIRGESQHGISIIHSDRDRTLIAQLLLDGAPALRFVFFLYLLESWWKFSSFVNIYYIWASCSNLSCGLITLVIIKIEILDQDLWWLFLIVKEQLLFIVLNWVLFKFCFSSCVKGLTTRGTFEIIA